MFVIYDPTDDIYVADGGDNQWTSRVQKARLFDSVVEIRAYLREYNYKGCTYIQVKMDPATGVITWL